MGPIDEDLARVLSLPVVPEGAPRCPDPEGFARELYHHAKPSDFALRPLQIEAAWEYATCAGSIIPLGVGSGKTLVSLSCCILARHVRGHHRVVLMVPTEVLSQLQKRDLPHAKSVLRLDAIPFYFVVGSPKERMYQASRPGSGVWVFTYHSLSTQTGYQELAAIAPTCFICDEAQNISRLTSARTKRLHSILHHQDTLLAEGRLGPDVKADRIEMVALSGTITKKRIEDYAHVTRRALRELSPVPIKEQAVAWLGACLNAEASPGSFTELDVARLRRMIDWSISVGFDPFTKDTNGVTLTLQEAAREAFRYRLRTARGVIGSDQASTDASLIISWREPCVGDGPGAQRLRGLMKQVVELMITPDDDPIEYGMHTFKWLWELTAGFYNSLVWPTVEDLQRLWLGRGKPITPYEAERLLEAAKFHHRLQQEYHKNLRKFLDGGHVAGCDTPLLVAAELVRQREGKGHHVEFPSQLVESYWQQREAAHDDLPSRVSTPVRVHDYKVRAAVEWCKALKGEGALVWFHHPVIGQWISELLTVEGVAHTCAFAGENEKAFAPGLVVLSYAHATGKNLQHQSRNLFVELRREAHMMEQGLGRTHRSGQLADEVRADIFVSNGFDLELFNNIVRDADYGQATTGTPQRLCYATYNPVIPPSNPRLALRLGIIRDLGSVTKAPNTREWMGVSESSAVDWDLVFSPISQNT
jgi:hypothetical protein